MSTKIDNIVKVVRESLINEPNKGVNQFINFSKSFAITPKLKYSAIILKIDYDEAADVEKRKNIIDQMLELTEKIVQDYVHNSNSEQHNLVKEKREKIHTYFKSVIPQKDTVCLITNLSKEFKKSNFELSNVNIELKLGEITGVVGENGNGKTTLFRLITGELAQDNGEISYPYLQTCEEIDWYSIRNQIAFVPQELDEWYGSLKDNLHYECILHDIKGQRNDEEVDYIIYRLGLSEHIDKSWHELSGGFKIRFALARALVWKPKLLVIDEPLANLDINAQLVIINDLRDLANSLINPVSIIVSSQHLFEIEGIADKIMFLKDGGQFYYGKREDLGKNRTANTFELICPVQLKDIEAVLKDLDILRIEFTGQQFIIKTALNVSYFDLLNALLQSRIEIIYFRNISLSVKELFL